MTQYLKRFKFLSPYDALYQFSLALDKWYFFLKRCQCCRYLPLKEGVALYFDKKDVLYPVMFNAMFGSRGYDL